MSIETFMVAIRRQETWYHRLLYRLGKALMYGDLPAPRWLFQPLYYLHTTAGLIYDNTLRTLYYQPMFRARCTRVGRGLYLYGGLAYVSGDLRISMGDGCRLSAKTTLVAPRVFDAPELVVGDDVHIGYGVTISVAQRVRIDAHTRVANGVQIMDNSGHPLDPVERRTQPVPRDDVHPVHIGEDVWIGSEAIILPGVTIGRGAVVGARAVVTRDVPAMSVVVGNPARVVKTLTAKTTAAAEPASRPSACVVPDALPA